MRRALAALHTSLWSLALCLLVGALASCGPDAEAASPSADANPTSADPATDTASTERPVIIVLGDSISAGKDLAKREAFPALLEERLADEGLPVRMINASESGITSRAGVERLDWLLAQDPDLLVVELGANDGLRGQPLEAIETNLAAILQRAADAGVEALLLGMVLPPNYGPAYTAGFTALYGELAERFDVMHVPFFMEPVAGAPELNLPDGLHPNAEGHERLATHLLPHFRAALERLARP